MVMNPKHAKAVLSGLIAMIIPPSRNISGQSGTEYSGNPKQTALDAKYAPDGSRACSLFDDTRFAGIDAKMAIEFNKEYSKHGAGILDFTSGTCPLAAMGHVCDLISDPSRHDLPL